MKHSPNHNIVSYCLLCPGSPICLIPGEIGCRSPPAPGLWSALPLCPSVHLHKHIRETKWGEIMTQTSSGSPNGHYLCPHSHIHSKKLWTSVGRIGRCMKLPKWNQIIIMVSGNQNLTFLLVLFMNCGLNRNDCTLNLEILRK